jgi:hypothetical protein
MVSPKVERDRARGRVRDGGLHHEGAVVWVERVPRRDDEARVLVLVAARLDESRAIGEHAARVRRVDRAPRGCHAAELVDAPVNVRSIDEVAARDHEDDLVVLHDEVTDASRRGSSCQQIVST